ncbi:hypothetical protein C2G38_2242476 [Gigaspora rosea]|uniref:F-box domain-containing protein n=1 Tax=Gigaspora rosea TaxID=44941 RepID=A0A397VMG7_9GLOM|nr:hypothetical protein C2G38_2242476 [Gigaspora rosea]
MSKEFNIENIIIFLKVLAKNITTISSLNLVIYSDFEPRLFHSLYHVIISIIKSQEQLKRFGLDVEDDPTELYGIISALECQKNSLQEVIIKECDYNKEFEVLKDCKNLETLRILNCSSKLLNLLDCKISTLEIVDCPIDVQTIPLILEKSGLLLQRLRFNSSDDIDEEFSIQLLELISSLQKLQFLTLWCFVDDDIQEVELKVHVIQFAKILPLTLQYLDLGDTWEPYIDIVLNLDVNFRKEVETHVVNVALVPSARIVVNF